MWTDYQIKLLNDIDNTWREIRYEVQRKLADAKGPEKSHISSWFVHLNCILNELKRQQNWEPDGKLKQFVMKFFGKYLERTVKDDVPSFSAVWNQNYLCWPVPPNMSKYSTIYGFDLYTSGNDMWSVLATGHYRQELSESLSILRILPEIELFLDVGANVGFYSLLVASASEKKVNVIAFEPANRNRRTFLKAVKANGFNKIIKIFPYAIGSHEGKENLHMCALGSGGHRIEPIESLPMTNEIETVKLTTLDSIQKEFAPNYPTTLIKIDVEGFEEEVLNGAESWLSNKNAPIILIEAWPKIAKSSKNHIEIVKKLKSFGYAVYPVLRAANTKPPLGKKCSYFNYKSPTGNYIALPYNKRELYLKLQLKIDSRIFTRREHLQAMLKFLKGSLSSLKSKRIT